MHLLQKPSELFFSSFIQRERWDRLYIIFIQSKVQNPKRLYKSTIRADVLWLCGRVVSCVWHFLQNFSASLPGPWQYWSLAGLVNSVWQRQKRCAAFQEEENTFEDISTMRDEFSCNVRCGITWYLISFLAEDGFSFLPRPLGAISSLVYNYILAPSIQYI